MAFTYLNVSVYSGLFGAGGSGTRNWSPDVITNGFTAPQKAPNASVLWLIGSMRHRPGSSLVAKSTPTYGSGTCEPSLALSASIAAAAFCPNAIPLVLKRPSRTWLKPSASTISNLPAGDG